MTRRPDASNTGASSADAASGSARKTASAANAAALSGTTVPSQIFASDGKRRGVLVACEPVATVMVTFGWRASRRISSCPAKPLAPATATRICGFVARWSPSVSFTVCIAMLNWGQTPFSHLLSK